MSAQDAQDIAQMNSASNDIPIANSGRKRSGLLWVVLGCIVVGVSLGIYVYQQSLKPATKPPTTKTTTATPKPSPIPSPETPQVSEVNAESKVVKFPKAGKLRAYYYNGSWMALGVELKDAAGGDSFTISSGTPSTPMKILDTGYELTGATDITIDSYLGSDSSKMSLGWATPQANNCGFNGFGQFSIASYLTWATEQAKGEPIVSVQCWGDWSPDPADTSAKDFNDYVMIWSYTPAGASTSPSSSPTASVSPSPSSSAKASSTPSASPSPSASVKASSSPAAGTAKISPSPSTRAAMPDTSEGVPVTGIFEVTVGTIGLGLVLLALGLAGLLVL